MNQDDAEYALLSDARKMEERLGELPLINNERRPSSERDKNGTESNHSLKL